MIDRVKKITLGLFGRLGCSPLTVALLDASRVGQVAPLAIELLSGGATEPPEWVRFLATGANKGRSGRVFTVLNADQVTRASTDWKGAIDLVVDYEHQFDRSRQNGQPAPASAWLKEFSATGPDGSPGIWARVEWLPDAAQLIRDRKYRYLSAVIEHDAAGNVVRVVRAALTNLPEMDTATALFSAHPQQEQPVNLLQKMLAAFGLAATTTEDDAVKHATGLSTLCAALAKLCGVEIAALSAMTADQVAAGLAKPLETKLATLSAAASLGADASPDAIVAGIRALGIDPTRYVDRTAYDDVSKRLAALTAEGKARLIEEGTKAGQISPGMKAWAESMSVEQLTVFLSAAPVIVAPGGGGGGGGGGGQGGGAITVATLSAEQRSEAARFGVTPEQYVASLNASAAAA